jgi:hypothetical protein
MFNFVHYKNRIKPKLITNNIILFFQSKRALDRHSSIVQVGVEESIVNAPRITDHGSAV